MWSIGEIGEMFNRYIQQSAYIDSPTLRSYDASRSFPYSCDFKSMPISFKWTDAPSADVKNPPKPLEAKDDRSFLGSLLELPQNMVSDFYMRTLGIKFIYPGATVMNLVLMSAKIKESRSRMLNEHQGTRAKLLTLDENTIDSMFIDRRGISHKGATLVICCEGNLGYYECGAMWTSIAAGYSVLGWNHPGFGESSGEPFPEQEVNAIDVVMKYALHCLNFPINDIILFGWSIGGYSASWAAMNYPHIKGLILDASFDHINHVILSKFPAPIRKFWESSLRKNFNLDISRHLNTFFGPVLVVRRTKDMVVSDFLSDRLLSNRSNHIIFNLFRSRFPVLMDDQAVVSHLWSYLSSDPFHQEQLLAKNRVEDEVCFILLRGYMMKNGFHYPMMIGKDLNQDEKKRLTLFLVSKHLIDFDDHHSTPLPARYLIEPWSIFPKPRASRTLEHQR